ncbi:glycoside hydrolase superfamily [Lineolata rhizophorae]|uniref:Glycoside hydrolase superfamily n=1 Tax=Lineolata rhizophorae TaxID=578093 RepID=A0A6A6NVA5_9PEZI|nr:glycoside hydrolase superfamily [Lineolata rhizophorae]
MAPRTLVAALSLLAHRAASAALNTTTSANPTATSASPSGPPTISNTDYSAEALDYLWSLVGDVTPDQHSTTVLPDPAVATGFSSPAARPLHPFVPSYDASLSGLVLPAGFGWGVASSAYQIEGAARAEGKGPSVWDFLTHQTGYVADGTTGDNVAEHYWLYKEDIARLGALGVPSFSPSFSWPRFFPFGKGPVNEEAVAHYDDVIATMREYGVQPDVTLFHWDTPLALVYEYGAWNSPQIVDDFFEYAKFVISRYDEHVHTWFTINEPQYCNWQWSGYPVSELWPSFEDVPAAGSGLESRFLCGHYSLLAHAKVAKWYHEEFKGQGRISFKNSGNYYESYTNSTADLEARQRWFDFTIGWFGGPWREDGDYPQSLKDTLGDLLPTFTEEEKEMIKGSCDFYALDGYTSYYVWASDTSEECIADPTTPGFPECANSGQTNPDGFPLGPSGDPGVSWLTSAPSGIRRFLNYITKELHPSVPDIQVTEFGFAEPFESQKTDINSVLWDLRRAEYYQGYLDNILMAIHYDNVNVTGALGWAIFDNFEWGSGVSVRFGMQYVDYDSLERTPKASLFQFLNWFKEHPVGGSTNATMVI